MPTVTIGDQTGATHAGSIDTGLNMSTPTTNKGGDTTFESSIYDTGATFVEHGLLAFPGLSSISGPVTVSAASIFVHLDGIDGNSQTISMFRLLRNWVETEATWNIFSTGNNWGTAGANNTTTDYNSSAAGSVSVSTASTGYQEFTGAGIIALVEGWINGTFSNFGVKLQRTDGQDDTKYVAWRSSEHATATTRPYLSVTYTASGGSSITPSVGALVLTGLAATVALSGGHSRTPSVGSLTLTGQQPVQTLTVAAPITGELTLTGNAATVLRGTVRQPSVGSLTLTGLQPSLSNPRTIAPSVGALTLTGLQASVSVGVANTILIPQPGALTLNGQVVTLIHSSPLIRPNVGALTLTGNTAGVLATSSRAYIGGTAVTETGVMITDFLDDATPVPSTKVMLAGIAHTQDGLRYVALWPNSGIAFYNGGRAIRSDGAMIIATAGTAAGSYGGIAMTYRGETIVSTDQPQLVHNGFGLRQTGALCVSEAS